MFTNIKNLQYPTISASENNKIFEIRNTITEALSNVIYQDKPLYIRANKMYKYNMPNQGGKINYINLSSITIYNISVSTTTLDNSSISIDNDIAFDGSEYNNFQHNEYYS